MDAAAATAATTGATREGLVLDGRYTLLRAIGEGSMSTVHRARQHAMGRDVAVKILRADRGDTPGSKERFLREARAHSMLGSPHTVSVLDFGWSASGEPYLVMELLEGESLASRIARVGKLAPADAVSAAKQVLASLSEAHANGIVHRDLKPENLFFARDAFGDEVLKVLDFGIAKVLRADAPELLAPETHVGTIFGTPRYMSPEQARGKPLDARSDLYSVGVVLYEMLAGKPPFTDRDSVVVMAHHVDTPPPPLRDACPEIAPELEALVMRMLAKDPDARPRDAEEIALALGGPPHESAPAVERPSERAVAPTTRGSLARVASRPWVVGAVLATIGVVSLGATWAVLARSSRAAAAAETDGARVVGAAEQVAADSADAPTIELDTDPETVVTPGDLPNAAAVATSTSAGRRPPRKPPRHRFHR